MEYSISLQELENIIVNEPMPSSRCFSDKAMHALLGEGLVVWDNGGRLVVTKEGRELWHVIVALDRQGANSKYIASVKEFFETEVLWELHNKLLAQKDILRRLGIMSPKQTLSVTIGKIEYGADMNELCFKICIQLDK